MSSVPQTQADVPVPQVVATRQPSPRHLEIELKLQTSVEKPAVSGFARLPLISDAVRMQIASQPGVMKQAMAKLAAQPAVANTVQQAVQTTTQPAAPAATVPVAEPMIKRVVEKLASIGKSVESSVVPSGGKDAHVFSSPAMADKLSASSLPRFASPDAPAAPPPEHADGQARPAPGQPPSAQAAASSQARAFAETVGASTPVPTRESASGAERVVATPAAPAPSTAPSAPVATAAPAVAVPQPPDVEVLDQVVQNATVMARDGKTSLSVRLVPEHLGQLDIQLAQEGGNITAQIVAREASTQQMLVRNFDQLHHALESAGLRISHLSVVPAPTASAVHALSQEPAPTERYASGQEHTHHEQPGG